MTPGPSLPRGWLHRLRGGPLVLARLLLLAWAVGLAVTFFHLDSWRRELSTTLLQLNADAQFRARAPGRDAVDPAWYRRKALALLAAAERLEHDTTWTLFVPGSWRLFDDLEERVEARIQREFGDIVVETITRELYAHAGQLTGLPLLSPAGAGGLTACRAPQPAAAKRQLSAAPQDLPEFIALQEYVGAVERLDAALQAFVQLQRAGGGPDQLRQVVAYTLGAELPGRLARSVRLFHLPQEAAVQPALLQARLQAATRCSLEKGMGALHARLLNTNDLFALEQGLATRSAGLFDATRPAVFGETLERYRAVHALLEDQHALLARGGNSWMREGRSGLGGDYEQLLQRIARVGLWGNDVQRQLDDQSGFAFAEFRRQFQSRFGASRAPGIVWLEHEHRFGLSPERAALREGLGTLLQAPFMAEAPAAANGRPTASLAEVVRHADGLAGARDAFVNDSLPRFPAEARPAVERLVDARVAELVYEQAFRTLKAGLPVDGAPLDPAQFRARRLQLAQLEELLQRVGGDAWARKLHAVLDEEVQRRMARLDSDWQGQPLLQAAAIDFADWDGEQPLALGARLGADGGSLARLAQRLQGLGGQAQTLAALATGGAGAGRWTALQEDAGRYQQRQGASSLERLERYLQALGPDLKRENCAQRLAAAAPPRSAGDPIAQRHVQVHDALATRCRELRAQQVAPPPPAPEPASAAPAPEAPPPELPALLPPPVLLP